MAKKLTEEQMVELCNKQNVTYLGNERFCKSESKSETHIIFICEKHKKYGEQHSSILNFKRQNRICKYCSHSALKETLKDELSEINPNIELLSEYKNWDTKLKCRCKVCGNEWNTVVSILLHGGDCPKCSRVKAGKSKSLHTGIKFVEQIKELCPTVELISEYQGNKKPIKCKCKIHGTEWETTPTRLRRKECKCPDCVKELMHEKFALTNNEFVQRVKEINPDIIPLEEYHTMQEPIKFHCSIHDIDFVQTPRAVIFKFTRCPKCHRSLGEIKLEKILDDNNIKYNRQHSFSDCKNINVLEFDIYCYEINTVIEYQGRQHYMPVDFAGKGEEWAQEQFEINQKRDTIKRKYCKEHNIKMIEIPYWEYDDMEDYLKQQLS